MFVHLIKKNYFVIINYLLVNLTGCTENSKSCKFSNIAPIDRDFLVNESSRTEEI